MMIGLVYLSYATQPFSESELISLANLASEKNERLQITGILQYKKSSISNAITDRFLQYLEGDSHEVMHLMREITKDPRHQVVRVIQLPEISNRAFKDWYMRYITETELIGIDVMDLLEDVLIRMEDHLFGEAYLKVLVKRLITQMGLYYQQLHFDRSAD